MWDNTEKNKEREQEGKKNLPQYSCKDKEGCGWIMWPDKEGRKTILVEHKTPAPKALPNGENREKAMFYSYAKDLAIAEMAAGISSGPAVQLTKLYFRELWSDYTNPLKPV
jgi:hypothetical protein